MGYPAPQEGPLLPQSLLQQESAGKNLCLHSTCPDHAVLKPDFQIEAFCCTGSVSHEISARRVLTCDHGRQKARHALAIASACSCAASRAESSSGFLSSDSWWAKKHTRRLQASPSVQHCSAKDIPQYVLLAQVEHVNSASLQSILISGQSCLPLAALSCYTSHMQ